MTSSHDLTTEEGLRAYLTARGQEPVTVALLSGGTANYVYRVESADGSTTIFKHAAPYLHSSKSFAFDQGRMDFEARALEMMSPVDGTSLVEDRVPGSKVRAVRLLRYDREEKLLEIEDGGERNLKDAYADPKLDIVGIAKELGEWIAAIHENSREISLETSSHEGYSGRNNHIAVSIYRHSYNNLCSALQKYGHDTNLAERINEEFGSLLATDDETVCHGDFWPGNVLVRLHNSMDANSANLRIVDWELVRRGTSATDVGQFAAEAFLLDRFRGNRGLLPAFLKAYVTARGSSNAQLGKTWVRRMVVHWAVHVSFWPTGVKWADEKGTRELVDQGVAVLKYVLDDEWEKIIESPLLRDVQEEWRPILDRV